MIRVLIALALVAAVQESAPESDVYAMAWFQAHLKDAASAKIEQIKPPRVGRRETGGGWGGSVFARGREMHVVTYRCYRVSERTPGGTYGPPRIYLMTEAPTGKMYEVKISPRKVTFPGRGKVDEVVEQQCRVW